MVTKAGLTVYDILLAYKVQYIYTYVIWYLKSMKMTDNISKIMLDCRE
jgi:hypothetical protein